MCSQRANISLVRYGSCTATEPLMWITRSLRANPAPTDPSLTSPSTVCGHLCMGKKAPPGSPAQLGQIHRNWAQGVYKTHQKPFPQAAVRHPGLLPAVHLPQGKVLTSPQEHHKGLLRSLLNYSLRSRHQTLVIPCFSLT